MVEYQANPTPRPAVRGELNRLRREGIVGEALLEVLSNIYHLYGLDQVTRQPGSTSVDENDEWPRIICSEALVE